MDDYEKKKFVAKAENLTVGQLLDVWAEEELKTSTLSNGTVENYLGTIRNIKKHPLAERKLKNVTSEHLQSLSLIHIFHTVTIAVYQMPFRTHSGITSNIV